MHYKSNPLQGRKSPSNSISSKEKLPAGVKPSPLHMRMHNPKLLTEKEKRKLNNQVVFTLFAIIIVVVLLSNLIHDWCPSWRGGFDHYQMMVCIERDDISQNMSQRERIVNRMNSKWRRP